MADQTELSAKHEAVIRKAAAAVRNRGHEGDARLADSLLGIVASLRAAAPEATSEQMGGAQVASADERALFHEHAQTGRLTLDRGSNLIGGKRVAHEDYRSVTTTAAWRAWKTRGSLATPHAAEEQATERKPLTDALSKVHKFLMGEGPLDGMHFGDSDTAKPRPRYWWRENLRRAIEQHHDIGSDK